MKNEIFYHAIMREKELIAIVAVETSSEKEFLGSKLEKENFNVKFNVLSRIGPYNQPKIWGGIYTNYYNNPSVKLSNGDIRIEYDEHKNLGIGTIIFNYIITWAKQFENTRVERIKLSDVDRDNKNRRNHFYEKFGIIFNYQDEKLTGGSIFELNTSDLRVADIDGGLNKLEFINKYRYELSENDSLMSKLECD